MDHVILNHGQVTWMTPELATPLLTTTPRQREEFSALDRFNVHRCSIRRVFSGIGLELVTRQATCSLWKPKVIAKNGDVYSTQDETTAIRSVVQEFNGARLELWFQQDGATCHTARATIDLLKDMFGDLLISRFGPVNWPPRSCDLTPLDYFLRFYVKSLVYADKPQTLDYLEGNIHRVIADIRPQMLENVIENWTSRLD
ncbi:transposable element Tc3 transposase [Trichonephila clavipes]|nr:transposable element Tc3 transposase [Trichonephila clavipes]